MEGHLLEDSFQVTKVIDCQKEYDNLSRVELESNKFTAVLDVHNKLYNKILKVGVKTDISLRTEIKISEQIQVKASDPAYNPKVSEKMKDAFKDIDYCMHGTVFEFQPDPKDNEKITIFISFGGLLLVITGQLAEFAKFKSGQKVYLMCKNTR